MLTKLLIEVGCQTTAFNPIHTDTLKDDKLYFLVLAYVAAASVNGSTNNKTLFLFCGLTYKNIGGTLLVIHIILRIIHGVFQKWLVAIKKPKIT
ncbi:13136_t:CDS:2 [Funneliformis geosporum]|uniref:13136_t:CDS:1 n=1 Tax=Funneliformis geosporum TaxID=1117311 RepID=A0A9W4SRR3_9GLOM|nr:13136_t:CDS:2 [Funneliformis geosporum]